jgi:hypothetical protein
MALTKMSTKNIFLGVKVADALGWQPYHLHVQIVLKSERLSLLVSSRPVQGLFSLLRKQKHHSIKQTSTLLCSVEQSPTGV